MTAMVACVQPGIEKVVSSDIALVVEYWSRNRQACARRIGSFSV
jgi:hypothetical protein